MQLTIRMKGIFLEKKMPPANKNLATSQIGYSGMLYCSIVIVWQIAHECLMLLLLLSLIKTVTKIMYGHFQAVPSQICPYRQ